MTYRVRNIAIAVALAVVAALLTTFYVTNYKENVQSQQENVQVLVAAKDIAAGTLGSQVIADKMLVKREVARQAVVPGNLTNPAQVKNLIATQATFAGEQVTARRFGPPGTGGVQIQLRGTYRAIQISGTATQLMSGTLKGGDHVDFVGNFKVPSEATQKHFSRVVLRDLLVLKTSGAPSTGAKITSPGDSSNWAMLRLTDAQAQKLFFVYRNGDWALQLRPVLDPADSPAGFEDAVSVLTSGVKGAQLKPVDSLSLIGLDSVRGNR